MERMMNDESRRRLEYAVARDEEARRQQRNIILAVDTLLDTCYNTRSYWIRRIDFHAADPRMLRYDRDYLETQAKLAEKYQNRASQEFWTELAHIAAVAVDALPEHGA
jgi:hypothetical protein